MFVAIVNNSMDSNYSTRYILFCQTNHRFAYFIHLKQTNQSIDGSCFCCFIYWVAYLLPSRVGVRGFYIIDGLCAGMGIFVYLMMMLVVY